MIFRETKTMSVTETLAKNVFALWNTPVPDAALARACIGFLDTLGVMLAGAQHPAMTTLRAVVLPWARTGQSTVVGTALSLNVADAALLNGAAAHMLDFDDSNSQLHGHPSVAVLPALLAIAEELNASGEDVLRAYICGIETCCRLGMGAGRYQYTHGWHPTATIGVFGGVAAAALLRGLDEKQLETAFGLVSSMACGIKANFGTPTKPFIIGHAARNAVMAVCLAHKGFAASTTAFDHHHGYLNVFNNGPDNYDVSRILEGWGNPLCILDMGLKQKPYPCCYACLPVVEAIENIKENNVFSIDDVESVHVAVHAIRYPHINVPEPSNALAAKFSVHYCVAQSLINGILRIEDFEGDLPHNPQIRDIMRRVTLTTYDRDNTSGADVTITFKDGRQITDYVALTRGASALSPLPWEEVRAKFFDCASRAIPHSGAHSLCDAITHLETAPSIRDILHHTRTPEAENTGLEMGELLHD